MARPSRSSRRPRGRARRRSASARRRGSLAPCRPAWPTCRPPSDPPTHRTYLPGAPPMSAALLAALASAVKFALAGAGGALFYVVAHKLAIVKTAEDTITTVEDVV